MHSGVPCGIADSCTKTFMWLRGAWVFLFAILFILFHAIFLCPVMQNASLIPILRFWEFPFDYTVYKEIHNRPEVCGMLL